MAGPVDLWLWVKRRVTTQLPVIEFRQEPCRLCAGFELWYADGERSDLDVCQCGHPRREHVGEYGSCTGTGWIEV